MYAQDELSAIVRQRLRDAGFDAPEDAEPATVAAAARSQEPALSAYAVLRELDPTGLACAVAALAAGLPADTRLRWRRAFTRTVFLTGNPANLAGRFAFDHVADDGSVALIGPQEPDAMLGLRRLLPLVADGPLPSLPPGEPRTVPGRVRADRPVADRPVADRPARGWRVTVATAGVGTAGYLVHLGHVVAEAVLDGHLHPGDRLSVRHVPRVLRDGAVTVRVHADGYDENRLRAYAALTPEMSTVE